MQFSVGYVKMEVSHNYSKSRLRSWCVCFMYFIAVKNVVVGGGGGGGGASLRSRHSFIIPFLAVVPVDYTYRTVYLKK